MRIIGGKDYYDSARAFGEDRETVFVRHNHDKAAPEKLEKFPLLGFYHAPDKLYLIDVIFCGKMFRGVVYVDEQRHYAWDFENFEALENKFNFRIKDEHRWYGSPQVDRQILKETFDPRSLTPEELDYVISKNIALAIRDRSESIFGSYHEIQRQREMWKVNTDGLKAIGFPSVVDPYTAFQELSMFVGGVLPRSPNPMVELSGEKIMTQKHGFDKWSFRRHKDDVR
jgi:hypothetical protein